MEEAHAGTRLERVKLALIILVTLWVFGTISDTPFPRVVYEMAPPPLPAAVGDRDASVVVTVTNTREEVVEAARVFVLSDIDGKVYRAGGGHTDERGVCRIGALPRGHAWVVADAEGYARASTSLVLAGARDVSLVLGPEHSFVINVVDAEGNPVPTAEIEVSQADDLPRGSRVDDRGRAEVGRLGNPPWVVTVRAPGYDETTARDVHDGAAIKIVLHRLGSILVHVVDGADRPVQGARVRIAGPSLWPAREGHTGEHGMVKLAGLFAGSYALRATEGTRCSPIELGVILTPGEDKEMTLRLALGRTVVVHTVDSDAEDAGDVEGARVVLAESGLSPFPFEAVTDKHGRATLGPIAPGPASLSARADGFAPGKAMAVPDVLEGELRVVLVRAGALTGRVTDSRGYPVASATIEVLGNDFSGGPIDDEPQRSAFQESEFKATLAGPAQLLPAGELGVVPGPVPAIPSAGALSMVMPSSSNQVAEPWVTSSDGTFRAEPITPGRVRVLVRHPEYVEGWSDLVTVAPGSEGHVDVVLFAGGSIEGRVVDSGDNPVMGARIELSATHGTLEHSTTSASDGTFAFAAVPAEVSLDVYADEDATSPVLRSQVKVADGERKEIVLKLPAARDPVAILVKDDRGYPVASAQVTMVSLDPAQPLRQTVFTDSGGEATLAGARGLSLRAETSAPGHALTRTTTDAAPAELDIVLGRAAMLSGKVRSSRGDPIADAEVVLYVDAGVRHLRTDEGGGFVASDVAPGPARLVVRASGYATTERRVTVPEQDAPFSVGTIDLASEGVVEGEVRDGHGDPVVGARVAKDRVPVFLPQGASPPDVVTTDSQGRFHLAGLAEGTVSLEAYSPDVGRGHGEARVMAGRSTTNVRIVLSPEGEHSETQPGATVAVTLGETGGDNHEVVVVVVADGSEAERAGVLPGDVLASVDGTAVHTIEQAREKLNGPASADVLLDLKRQGSALRLRVPREMVRR